MCQSHLHSYLLHKIMFASGFLVTRSQAGVTFSVVPKHNTKSQRSACSSARFNMSSSKLSQKLIMVSSSGPLQTLSNLF